MKKLFTAILLVFATYNTFAQDIIRMKDKSKITCKIIERIGTEIKYKNWDDQDGPTHSIKISDVLAVDSIEHREANFGKNEKISKGINEGISSIDFNTLDFLKRDDLLRRSRIWNTIGWLTLPSGVLCTIFGIIAISDKAPGAAVLTAGGAVGIGVSAILLTSASHFRKKAFEIDVAYLYEKSFHIDDNVFSTGVSFLSDNHQTNGIGVGVRYNF